MIKEYILSRGEVLIEDFSSEQMKLWEGEVIDFRVHEDVPSFAQELFDTHKHTIFPTFLKAMVYHKVSEFSFVFEAKMSNGDHIRSTYKEIKNQIPRDGHLERHGILKIYINGEDINYFLNWSVSSLSNFGSLRNFYFNHWIPSLPINRESSIKS